jgi:large subunit ribosomal protein L30
MATKAAAHTPPKRLKITQVRSAIGFDRKQELALQGLGLRRIRHTVEVVDTPATRGLILKIRHLVTVDGSPRLED